MNRKKISLLVGVLIILVVAGIYGYPRHVTKTYDGIRYRLGDSESEEPIIISIDGYYNRNLISEDRFVGDLVVDGEKLEDIDVYFEKSGQGHIRYYKNVSDSDFQFYSYGNLFMDDKSNELTIALFKEDGQDSSTSHWNSRDGLMVAAPATTREEALVISSQLMEEQLRSPDGKQTILE